ncbi:MAG: hypothetical protein R3E12_04575 [Candidatus Eisenbacteria bacterium]
MRLPSALLQSLVLGIVFLAVTAPHPARAWDGIGGELAVLRLDDGRIDAPDDAVWLLGWNQDLAVLLVPPAWRTPEEWKPRLTRLEAPVHGAYYLVLCEDAQRLRVADPARTLARHGHTVLTHTMGAPPATALDGSHGLLQPVRLDLDPKPWPSAATTELVDNFAIDFDPLVGQIAAQVDEAGYVAVWQALDDFETRYTFTAQNEAAANWMYDILTSYGLEVNFHVYQQSGPKKNVVATIPGTTNPEQVV